MKLSSRIQSLMALGAALLVAAALSACGGGHGAADAEGHQEGAVVLGASDVATAVVADLAEGVPVSGNLAPTADARLISPYDEALEVVLVQEGERVRKGQVLARFQSGALAPAAASAEAQRRIAEADLTRMRNLEQAGAISQRDVDNAEAAFKAAEATAAAAGKRLGDATVRAPFDGVVADRSVKSGDRVGAGDPLFRVVNIAQLEFEARVTAENASRLQVGTPVALTVSGLPDAIEGHIARINATADPATRQVRVYVAVANRDGKLKGDLFASGRVVLREARRTLAVPIPAVHATAGGASQVWVIASGKLGQRAVKPGLVDEAQNLVQVEGALQPGDTLVVSAVEGLVAGQAVQLAGRGK
jgi:membrane fusion protein, multidrug efflux system